MKRKLQRGFSLVEVMCALLILGVGLAGLTEGITTALRSAKDAERQSEVALLAAGQIELLRADGYVIEGETTGDFTGPFSHLSWRQAIDPTDLDGLFEVTVVVQETRTGRDIFELKTMLFDPPFMTEEEREKERKERRKQ